MQKLIFSIISLIVGFSAFGFVTVSALAPDTTVATATGGTAVTDACAGLTQIDSSHDCSTGKSSVTSIVGVVVNILSYIIGIVAVIMVIIAGLKYVASNGDSGRISSAKNTLVYALVGLAVAALAQVLVHFVLTQSTKAANDKTVTSGSLIRLDATRWL